MTPDTRSGLTACFRSVDALIDDLDDDQWAVQSLCPAWTVRGTIEHLGSIEHMLLGEPPGSMTETIPFGKAGEWIADVEHLDNSAFRERYRATVSARSTELDSLTSDQMESPSLTPIGAATYDRFMAIRVFDYWVHEQDIRVPLGLPGHESGVAAEIAIDEIHRSLPYIVGKKIGLPDTMSITIDLTGAVTRSMHVVVDGRAGLVDDCPSPDVTVTVDSTIFALLACGRIDPDGPIGDGRISWEGSDRWGEAAARNLAFTM